MKPGISVRFAVAMASLLVTMLAGLLLPTATWAASTVQFNIHYARFSAQEDPREKVPLALLALAFEKMQASYTVQACPDVMERSRALLELEKGQRINLMWTSMGIEPEKKLRPIRIPIYRGLTGHRLFLIPKSKQAEFGKIKTLADLSRYSAGVGLGWGDGTIMEQGGLKVVRARYDALFKLLAGENIDYFPRGAFEIFPELTMHQKQFPNLMIDPSILLVYKSDIIFYTSKQDEALANIIEKGLLMAYEDGSFLKLFNEHPYLKQMLREAGLEKRLRLELPNPLLSDEDRAIPARFWIHTDAQK